jgi:hypothetical protein
VCGTARQGLCYMYDASNINSSQHFKITKYRDEYRNFIGSDKSAMMHITKSTDGYDIELFHTQGADFSYKSLKC